MKYHFLPLAILSLCQASEFPSEVKTASELIAATQAGSYALSPLGVSDTLSTIKIILSPAETHYQESLSAFTGHATPETLAQFRKTLSPAINAKSYTISDQNVILKSEGKQALETAGDISIETSFQSPETATDKINGIVSSDTQGAIQIILKPTDISSNTGLVLLNTVFVKTGWKHPLTKLKQAIRFKISANSCHAVQASYGDINCHVYETGDHYFVGIDTQESELLMILKLAKTDYEVSMITSTELNEFLKNSTSQKIALTLPNGYITTIHDLKAELSPKISILKPNTWFQSILSDKKATISLMRQIATVEWDEKGFMGAAATTAVIGLKSLSRQLPTEIVFDRPFSFTFIQTTANQPIPIFEGMIKDEDGLILFHETKGNYGCNPTHK